MFFNSTNQMQDDQYLRRQIDKERERVRQLEEERERERSERHRRINARREHNKRTASTWPEALQKQEMLFLEEAVHEDESDDDECNNDMWFTNGAQACGRALKIWSEVEKERQEEINELMRHVETIREQIRLTVAKRLKSENDHQSWRAVASAIRQDEDLDYWLNW